MIYFKNKIGFSFFAALVASLAFAEVGTAKMVDEDVSAQRALRALSIHEYNGQYYGIQIDIKKLSLKELKSHWDRHIQGPAQKEMSLNTSRQKVIEERMKQFFPVAHSS